MPWNLPFLEASQFVLPFSSPLLSSSSSLSLFRFLPPFALFSSTHLLSTSITSLSSPQSPSTIPLKTLHIPAIYVHDSLILSPRPTSTHHSHLPVSLSSIFSYLKAMTRKRHVRRNRRLRYRPSEDRPPKKPKLSWDTYQRQVLCCLYRFFECSNDQLSALFSTIFRSHLRQYGYGDSDVPYRTLVSQWYWLRRQNRPVWHHVHVATAFRTDGEWKDIIHRIRMTAFELGILLNEKRFDTIAVPDDKFDVNKDPCEFLTSVLLSSSPTTQHPSSMKGSVDTGPEISTEDTRGSHG